MRFVNSIQTKEERKEKYKMLKDNGADSALARRCRDWTSGHIERIILPRLKDVEMEKGN